LRQLLRVPVRQQTPPAPLVFLPGVEQHWPWSGVCVEALQSVRSLGRGEDEPGAAVVEGVGEHLVTDVGVQGHDDGPGPDRAQARHDPLDPIAGEECHVVSSPHAGFDQAASQPLCVADQLVVGPALDILLVQGQNGRPIPPLVERVEKGSQRAQLAHGSLLL
jgi:hypothetical protein